MLNYISKVTLYGFLKIKDVISKNISLHLFFSDSWFKQWIDKKELHGIKFLQIGKIKKTNTSNE